MNLTRDLEKLKAIKEKQKPRKEKKDDGWWKNDA